MSSPATVRLVALLALALLLLTSPVVVAGDEEEAPPEAKVPEWAKVSDAQKEEAKKHGIPVAFENKIGMRFVLIPSGAFVMGSPVSERMPGLGRDYEMQHTVTITKPYYMQVTEVTNAQFRRKVTRHHSQPPATQRKQEWASASINEDEQPVVMVDYFDATKFARWVSLRDRDRLYRLPTEAEWEYACRAGTQASRYFGDDAVQRYENVADQTLKQAVAEDPAWDPKRERWPTPEAWAWVDAEDGFVMTAPVGQFLPNNWGLHDMLGNVCEWCADWFGPYPTKAVVDPTGPTKSQAKRAKFPSIGPHPAAEPPPPVGGRKAERVHRGGSWMIGPYFLRAASRSGWEPKTVTHTLGFRLVSPIPSTPR